MMVIRPIQQGDLNGLMELAKSAGVGLTSLPVNEERLARRIARSERAFAGEAEKADQGYVFVLEDSETGNLAGICGIDAAVGLKETWYNYRVGTIVHSSEELGVYTKHDTLFLSNDHTGFSELCSLFLHPEYRVNKNGGFLSKCRFLFLAEFPELFAKTVVAEMRGVSDADGRSPFWESLGRHFFSIDFAEADYRTGVGQKAFVAELMPKYPVYIDFLPKEAQEVIGQTHENTRPALAMLQSEGFRYEGYVDIFDAGPTVQAYASEIRAVRESRLLPVAVVHSVAEEGRQWVLVSNRQLTGFRVILIEAPVTGESLALTAEQARALNVEAGDTVRAVTLSPKEKV
jgi:arginine N-succinyltransferase